jgi:hypothetical protein
MFYKSPCKRMFSNSVRFCASGVDAAPGLQNTFAVHICNFQEGINLHETSNRKKNADQHRLRLDREAPREAHGANEKAHKRENAG